MKSNFKEFLSILDSALEPPDDPMFRPKKTVVTYNLNKPKWFYPSLTAACCIACIGVTLAVSLPVTINKDYSVQRVNNEAKNHYGSKNFEELFSRALIDQKIYLFYGEKNSKSNILLISTTTNNYYCMLSYNSATYKFENGMNDFYIDTNEDSVELNFSIYKNDKIVLSSTFYLTLNK
mgnify:FL=1